MNIHLAICTALALATASWPGSARSETVYRCGDSYSQVACPGGSTLDVSDPRTPAQKAQTDAAARQAALSASRLEKERLALEKLPTVRTGSRHAAGAAGQRTAKGKTTDPPAASAARHKARKDPEYFTAAAAPADKQTEKARRTATTGPSASGTEAVAKP